MRRRVLVLAALCAAALAVVTGVGGASAEEPPPTIVSFSADASELTVPSSTYVRVTASRSLYNSGYKIVIVDDDGRSAETTCGSSNVCSKAVAAVWNDNENALPRHFHAEIRELGSNVVVSRSDQVTIEVKRHDFDLQFSADSASITAPNSTAVRATVDQTLYNTGYRIHIISDDGLAPDTVCGSSNVCAKNVVATWQSNTQPGPRQYHAEVRDMSTGYVAAVSGPAVVNIEPYDFDLQLTPEADSIVVPNATSVRATVNRSLYETGYRIRLIDESGEAADSLCSGGDSCTKNVTAPWSVNPNPTAKHYRAQVEHLNGHVADVAEQVTVVRRRYIFPVDLSFSSVTDANGTVTHEVTGTTSPSVYGTGYQLRLKRIDTGAQICGLTSGTSCTRSAQVGGTYQAFVEKTGHVAGASGAWLLGGSGPELAMLGAVNLAHLAARFPTVTALCEELLVKGGYSGGDTLPDAYQVCEAAVAAGKTVLQALIAVSVAGGGAALIHQLSGDEVAPPLPTDRDPEPEDSIAQRPMAPPVLSEIQDLADQLQAQNARLAIEAAEEVARQCKLFMGRLGNPADDCLKHPIIAPGGDMPTITKHTLTALGTWPLWAKLHYHGSKPAMDRDWYRGIEPCATYDTAVVECDEFPFFPTREGGPAPSPPIAPSLQLVPKAEHRVQGGHMGQFYSACGLSARPANPPFWVIPMHWEGPRTQKLCNGWSG